MTSTELQQKIDTATAEMTSKQNRLAAIAEEKRRVLHDEKKLGLLEQEESNLPVLIVRLQERVRLLSLEYETMLAQEATARSEVLQKE